MNHDDAVDEARKALSDRLKAWGVPDPYTKANGYIDGLLRRGWRWHSEQPRPPRPAESCDICGRHERSCICDEPKPERPRGQRTTDKATDQAACAQRARALLRAAKEDA